MYNTFRTFPSSPLSDFNFHLHKSRIFHIKSSAFLQLKLSNSISSNAIKLKYTKMSFKYLQRDLKVASPTCKDPTSSPLTPHLPHKLHTNCCYIAKGLANIFICSLCSGHTTNTQHTHTDTHTHPKCETLWDALDTHPKKRRNRKRKEKDETKMYEIIL